MKLRYFHRFCIAAIGLLHAYNAAHGHSLSTTVLFDETKVGYTTQVHGNVLYSLVHYPNADVNDTIGNPHLPSQAISFQIPINAKNLSTTLSYEHSTSVNIPNTYYPIQRPYTTTTDEDEDYDFTPPSWTDADLPTYFPKTNGNIITDGLVDGCNRIVTVSVSPFQFNPIKEETKFYKNITVTLNYDLGDAAQMRFPAVFRQTPAPYAMDIIKPERFHATVRDSINMSAASDHEIYLCNDSIPGYQYTIITSKRFAPAFKRLVALQKHLGVNAGIITMEQIRRFREFKSGDPISGIKDDAGTLRAYLIYAYEHLNTEYVLLGGTTPDVPIRYGRGWKPPYTTLDTTDKLYNDYDIPSDLYFADLNSNWWPDHKNVYYGTPDDNLDYFPELKVGRLLCKTPDEINAYIDKLELYNFNPGKGDMDYLDKAWACYGTEFINESEFFEYNLRQCNVDIMKIEGQQHSPKGADVIGSINSSPSGILSLHGHGGPNLFLTTHWNDPFYIASMEEYQDDLRDVESANNGLDNLNNRWMPGICYSISCDHIPYDHFKNHAVPMNFGSSYTLGNGYGGVAFIGNTRFGYMATSARIEGAFWNLIAQDHSLAYATHMSKVCQSKISHYLCLSNNLIGDPYLKPWHGAPSTQDSISSSRSLFGISVTSSNLIGKTIVRIPLNGDAPLIDIATQNSITYRIPSHNCAVCVLSPSQLPMLCHLDVKGEDFANEGLFYVSSAELGTYGLFNNNVALKDGCNFTIKASGDIILGPHFSMENGSVLTLITDGNVTLDHCIADTQAKLNITCNELFHTEGTMLPHSLWGELNIKNKHSELTD